MGGETPPGLQGVVDPPCPARAAPRGGEARNQRRRTESKRCGRGTAGGARECGRGVASGARERGRGAAGSARECGRGTASGARECGRGVAGGAHERAHAMRSASWCSQGPLRSWFCW